MNLIHPGSQHSLRRLAVPLDSSGCRAKNRRRFKRRATSSADKKRPGTGKRPEDARGMGETWVKTWIIVVLCGEKNHQLAIFLNGLSVYTCLYHP